MRKVVIARSNVETSFNKDQKSTRMTKEKIQEHVTKHMETIKKKQARIKDLTAKQKKASDPDKKRSLAARIQKLTSSIAHNQEALKHYKKLGSISKPSEWKK